MNKTINNFLARVVPTGMPPDTGERILADNAIAAMRCNIINIERIKPVVAALGGIAKNGDKFNGHVQISTNSRIQCADFFHGSDRAIGDVQDIYVAANPAVAVLI